MTLDSVIEHPTSAASQLTHINVIDKLSILPDISDPNIWIPILLVPLAVQWWASYYPGAEPGGGGVLIDSIKSSTKLLR